MDCSNKYNITVKRYINDVGNGIHTCEINGEKVYLSFALSAEPLAKLIAKSLNIEYNPANYHGYYGSEDYYDNMSGKGSKNKIYSYLDYYCFHEKINLRFEDK